jgi:hypothetical protein
LWLILFSIAEFIFKEETYEYEKWYFGADGGFIGGVGLCRMYETARGQQLYAYYMVGKHGPGRTDGKSRGSVQK